MLVAGVPIVAAGIDPEAEDAVWQGVVLVAGVPFVAADIDPEAEDVFWSGVVSVAGVSVVAADIDPEAEDVFWPGVVSVAGVPVVAADIDPEAEDVFWSGVGSVVGVPFVTADDDPEARVEFASPFAAAFVEPGMAETAGRGPEPEVAASIGLAAVPASSFAVWRRVANPAPETGRVPGAFAEETATETAAISMFPALCTVVDDLSAKSWQGRKQTVGQSSAGPRKPRFSSLSMHHGRPL